MELEDIQGIISHGFRKRDKSLYALLNLPSDPAHWQKALHWLRSEFETKLSISDDSIRGRAVDQDKSNSVDEDYRLTVAFSYPGLCKLGVYEEPTELNQAENIPGKKSPVIGFDPSFKSGLYSQWNKIGGSDAPTLDWGGSLESTPDLIIMLFSSDTHFEEHRNSFVNNLKKYHFGIVQQIDGYLFDEETQNSKSSETRPILREHFGFRDGISQPSIEGLTKNQSPGTNTIKPGEFVLGYKNERGVNPATPTITRNHSRLSSLIHELPVDPKTGNYDIGRNGSYLVCLKIEQNVSAFKSLAPEIQAKMMGRWPSGCPVTLSPDKDNPSLGTSNDFLYFDDDRKGLKCPLGAHIRRANPRDSLNAAALDEKSSSTLKRINRHRILRRGRLYKEQSDTYDTKGGKHDKKGIVFQCLNASIANQFEFIMESWVNAKNFNILNNEVDPIVGANSTKGGNKFTIPDYPVSKEVKFNSFIEIKAGAYFFLPGEKALKVILSPNMDSTVPAAQDKATTNSFSNNKETEELSNTCDTSSSQALHV